MSDETDYENKESGFIEFLNKMEPSTFNLDTAKRRFNELKKDGKSYFDTEFEEQFDKEKFSLWKFQYNNFRDLDNKPDFMVKNLINGFKQNLPKGANQHLFGVINLISPMDGNWIIEGALIVRGKELSQELLDDMYDSFTWTSNACLNDLKYYFTSLKDEMYFRALLL